MNSFDEAYLKILNEHKNYFGYEINDETFTPFEYKSVYCCASYLNKNINHVLERLKSRTNNDLNDIFIVLKRGIDKFLQLSKTKYKNRIKNSFHIISKEYKNFKLVIEITKNQQKDILKYLENQSDFFYKCDYICFLYTILESNMIKKSLDDELYVEEVEDTNNEILYVN